MHSRFKQALENDQVVKSVLSDGSDFIVNDVQYYQATEDGFNLSIGRFHAFGDTLRRHDELKLTDDMMTTYLETLESMFRRCRAHATTDPEQVLDAASEGLGWVARIKERRTLGLSMEQVYEIGSLFHFSDEEDPTTINPELNRRKINAWLKSEDRDKIFFSFVSSQIRNYLPLQGLSDPNTLNSLMEINDKEMIDLAITYLKLKMGGTNSETMSIIESRKETLFGLAGLLSNQFNRISTIVPPSSEPS